MHLRTINPFDVDEFAIPIDHYGIALAVHTQSAGLLSA